MMLTNRTVQPHSGATATTAPPLPGFRRYRCLPVRPSSLDQRSSRAPCGPHTGMARRGPDRRRGRAAAVLARLLGRWAPSSIESRNRSLLATASTTTTDLAAALFRRAATGVLRVQVTVVTCRSSFSRAVCCGRRPRTHARGSMRRSLPRVTSTPQVFRDEPRLVRKRPHRPSRLLGPGPGQADDPSRGSSWAGPARNVRGRGGPVRRVSGSLEASPTPSDLGLLASSRTPSGPWKHSRCKALRQTRRRAGRP